MSLDVTENTSPPTTADPAVEGSCDIWGNPLGRGGFPRSHVGAALVTDPTGAITKSGPRKGLPKMLPYRGPSGIVLSTSGEALSNWKQDRILLAFSNPGFVAWAAAALADIDDPDSEEGKAALRAIRAEAHEVAETEMAAKRGTFAHWLTECEDLGVSPIGHLDDGVGLHIDPASARRIKDGWRRMNIDFGFENLHVEINLVNDEMRAAGTADRVIRLLAPLTFTHDGETITLPAGSVLISDLKTGKLRLDRHGRPEFWEKYAGQLATYARSKRYDAVTGTRHEWPDGEAPSTRWGILVHGDLERIAAGEDRTGFQVFVVDLAKGADLATASNGLRDAHRVGKGSVTTALAPPVVEAEAV